MCPLFDGGDAATQKLGFDPETVLQRDSRVLLDPSFLGTLHEELVRELAPGDVASTLLQMGFLHGLQDVTRLLALSPDGRSPDPLVFVPPLRMPCRTRADRAASAALHIDGAWPDRSEAEACLSVSGAGGGVSCHLSAGYTSGWLSGAFDVDLLAVETHCSAAGARDCRFEAREASAWRSCEDADVRRSLAALPFGSFRALVRERLARATRPARGAHTPGGVDRGASAVHVWGPVMVMPYAGPDAALETLELLGRDAGAAQVSVIVLDLHGAMIDEAYGAVALEQLVETAESWGTEVLFADPSPLSEAVLADLDPPPLLMLKDLPSAVALAFQISRSQRRVV